MDEIVVRLARTLASQERLRILSYLVAHGEKPPIAVGRELGIAGPALSGHLAKLAAVGLIKRRRSGSWSYCIAESPYAATTLSGQTVAWVRELLAAPERALKNCGLHEVRNRSVADVQTQLHRLIFEAATAFTDLRRLQILRRLERVGEASAETLCNELKMSAWAIGRHTSKLVRRGYLTVRQVDAAEYYRLAAQNKTPVHARLLAIVRSTWLEKPVRTS